MTVWWADHLGANAGFQLYTEHFPVIVSMFYGEVGVIALAAGSLALQGAALLVLAGTPSRWSGD